MRLAIYGKIRAGKSEVGKHIREYLIEAKNETCEIYEFSDAVQACVEVMYPRLKGIKDREKLIKIGQHMRKIDEDVWVNVIKNNILNSKSDNVLVVGVRQENEFEMLKELGFTFIRVEAPIKERKIRSILLGDKNGENLMNNETEMIMDSYISDHLITNDRDLNSLRLQACEVIEKLR